MPKFVFALSDDEHEALKQRARADGRSMANYLRRALAEKIQNDQD